MTGPVIELAGERVALLAERALHWEGAQAVIAADVHWGKAATFRSAGVPVPAGTTSAGLARLDRALARTGAHRLFVLGDLLHARAWQAPGTVRAIAEWREGHPDLEIVLIRGNHDRRAGDPPASLAISVVEGPWRAGPFILRHEPEPDPEGYVLAGHLHPGLSLRGPARARVRLPCFAFGAAVGILPAFGEFTGLELIEPRRSDRVYVVAGDDVVPVPPVA